MKVSYLFFWTKHETLGGPFFKFSKDIFMSGKLNYMYEKTSKVNIKKNNHYFLTRTDVETNLMSSYWWAPIHSLPSCSDAIGPIHTHLFCS